MNTTVHIGMVLKFEYTGFIIDWCTKVRNGMRHNACKIVGRKVLESKTDRISLGPFIEASAANNKAGEAAAVEDLMLP